MRNTTRILALLVCLQTIQTVSAAPAKAKMELR
jgi:hypothetical protein